MGSLAQTKYTCVKNDNKKSDIQTWKTDVNETRMKSFSLRLGWLFTEKIP